MNIYDITESSNGPSGAMYFFNVSKTTGSFTDQQLRALGLRQTKSGKWYYKGDASTAEAIAKRLNIATPKPWSPGPKLEDSNMPVAVDSISPIHGMEESERNEMDTPEFRAALAALKKKAQQGPTKAVLNPKTGKYIFVPVDQLKKKSVEEGSYQYHVVSKLDGTVLASYKTKEDAHKNAYGNPVVSGSLETIGDHKYVIEPNVAEGNLDPSGLIAAASMVSDYIITAEVDGKIKKFRIRGMSGPNAVKERFLKHHSMAKILDVKPEHGVAEGYTGRETKDGTWRVFKDGQAVAVAGPFKSPEEATAWIKQHGVAEGEGDPEGLPHLTKDLASHISQQIDTEGPHAIVKSVEWGDGAAKELLAKIKEMLDDYAAAMEESAAWQRKEGKNKNGGLNAKGVASYRRENPGSKLQTAVTTKPSKLKPGSKAAKRRKSFCARMGGMKGPMKDEHGKPTRKALALRKWNCESVEQFEMMIESHFKQADMLKESLRTENPCWKGYHPVGTKKKNGRTVPNCVPKEGVEEAGIPTWQRVPPTNRSPLDRAKEIYQQKMRDANTPAERAEAKADYEYFLKQKGVTEDAEGLSIGDDVIITGDVQFKGSTGIIDSFGGDKHFVVVNLYNHGKISFHSSDVSYNDYADSDDEDMRMHDTDKDYRDWMHNQDVDEDQWHGEDNAWSDGKGQWSDGRGQWDESIDREVADYLSEMKKAGYDIK